MRKIGLLFVVAAMFLAILAACGGNNANEGSPAPSDKGATGKNRTMRKRKLRRLISSMTMQLGRTI